MNNAINTGAPTVASLTYRTTENLRNLAAKMGDRFLATNHGTYNTALFSDVADERAYTIETIERIAVVIRSR